MFRKGRIVTKIDKTGFPPIRAFEFFLLTEKTSLVNIEQDIC